MSLDQAFNWTRAPPGLSLPETAVERTVARDIQDEEMSTPPPPASLPPFSGGGGCDQSPSVAMFSKSPDLDFYVEAGPSRQRSPSPRQSNGSTLEQAAQPSSSKISLAPSLSHDAWTSLKSVCNSDYQSAQPRQAAKALVALLSAPDQTSDAARFPSRSMSTDDRSKIVANLRDSPSAFQGALLDEPIGRRLLATWLRDTIDESDLWGSTRLPLLRLLLNAPILQSHIVDSSTKSALAKSVGYVQKHAPPKAKELAMEVRLAWEKVAKGQVTTGPSPKDAGPSKNAAGSASKRLAIDDQEDLRDAKKGKTTSADNNSSTMIRPTSSETMQSLASLSQSSAYLSSVSRLGTSDSQKKAAASAPSKLSLSGADRSSDLQSMAKKSVTRVDGDSKQVCPKCKTPMIAGITSTTRIKPSAAAGHAISQLCNKCQTTARKTPAPPSRANKVAGSSRLAFDDEDDSSSSSTSKIPSFNKAPQRRPVTSNDMFMSLLGKSEGKKPAAAKASGSAEAEPTAVPKKPKKRVRWREGTELVAIREIENIRDMDADPHAEAEHRDLHSLEMDEGSALRAAQTVDEMEEELEWYNPTQVFRHDPAPTERGSHSDQARKEEEREKSVVCEVYMEESDVPLTPSEGIDMQPVDPRSEPRAIPPPTAWALEAVSANGNIPLSELMKQLTGAGSNDGADSSATSLEALGISSSGLQQLLGSMPGSAPVASSAFGQQSGGYGAGPAHPRPPPAPLGGSSHGWGPPQHSEQSAYRLPQPFGISQQQQPYDQGNWQHDQGNNQRGPRARKRRTCTFWQKGQCFKGDSCTFAHSY